MSIIEKAMTRHGPLEPSLILMPMEHQADFSSENLIEQAADRQAGAAAQDVPIAGHAAVEGRADGYSRIGQINLAKLHKAGMITPDGEKSQIAEEFRLIKRPLITNVFNQTAPIKNANLIMVTSSLPGEGKSFCAINLAMSIAMEMDHTVLLVDADVAKPSLPGLLGLKAEKGLMDVLLDDELQLCDVMIKTNVEKLTVLPAGRGNRYATEMLASEAMTRLLQEMANRYRDRVIIFDSPPLLATTEARVLAAHMGQIVMVVEAEKTTHDQLQDALAQIESCDVVGLVLNKGKALLGTDYPLYGY
ncbi:MAG: XrtA-associated tyrosine autokinase [Sulfuricella sp.]|nr:XrtA-associated tyrosine autokinase [Sulfuricella sp.]